MFGHYSQLYFEDLIKEKKKMILNGQLNERFEVKMVIGLIKSHMSGEGKKYLQSYVDFLNLDGNFVRQYQDCHLILSKPEQYIDWIVNSQAELALENLKKYQQISQVGGE